MTPPSKEEKALKIRSLLQSYYVEDDVGLIVADQSNQVAGSTISPSPAPSSYAPSINSDSFPAIDTSYFDAESHLRRMIKETRLTSLIDQHSDLANEVCQLDSDMQTLVYENYSKFISATDIIRHLDGAMSNLDGSLHQLENLINDIVQRSESVNGTLEQRQATIIEMTKTREILHQLQTLFDIPRKLRGALRCHAYDVAVDIYASVLPIISKHGQRRALKNVSEEIEELRAELAHRLRGQLNAHPENAADVIVLIAQLREPTGSLQDEFLACQQHRIEAIIDDISYENHKSHTESRSNNKTENSSSSNIKGSSNSDKNNTSPVAAINSSYQQTEEEWIPLLTAQPFLKELNRTIDLYNQLFDPESYPRLIYIAKKWVLQYMAAVKKVLVDASVVFVAHAIAIDPVTGSLLHNNTAMTTTNNNNNNTNTNNTNTNTTNTNTTNTNNNDAVSIAISTKFGVPSLIAALTTYQNELPLIETRMPELLIRDKISELIGNVLRQHIALSFIGIEARVTMELRRYAQDSFSISSIDGSSSIPPFHQGQQKDSTGQQRQLLLSSIPSLSRMTLIAFHAACAGINEWTAHAWIVDQFSEVFITSMQVQILAWMAVVPQRCSALAGVGEDPPQPLIADATSVSSINSNGQGKIPYPTAWEKTTIHLAHTTTTTASTTFPMCTLGFSVFCSFMSTILSQNIAVVVDALSSSCANAVSGSGSSMPSASEYGKTAHSAAISLLEAYKASIVTSISALMEHSVHSTAWMQHEDAKGPRVVCFELLQKLGDVDDDLSVAEEAARLCAGIEIQPSLTLRVGTQPSSVSSSSSLVIPTLGHESRIVAWSSRAEILSQISSMALQSLSSSLRKHTLNRGGFQQIQLDCHYLQPLLQKRMVGVDQERYRRDVVAALDEVLVVAAERCGEPVLLEPSVLDRMIHASMKSSGDGGMQ